MSLIKIVIYQTTTRKEPFSKWLLDLEEATRAIIVSRLKRVSLGNFGDCKRLKEAASIWELRIDFGAGYRIYFGKEGSAIVVLLAGGSKKSQTPDIAKAKKYWLDYEGSLK